MKICFLFVLFSGLMAAQSRASKLEASQLSDSNKGLVGLWVGNNWDEDFANLKIVSAGVAAPPERVSFATQDGGLIYANLYGKGERGVVLAYDNVPRRQLAQRTGPAQSSQLTIVIQVDY